MMELWQTEWCPASRRIRQRLTELDVTYLIRQVPVEKADRGALVAATGGDSIPALVLSVLIGEDAIAAYLDQHVPEPAGASAHREKAEKARRREAREAAGALLTQLPTHAHLSEVSQ
jgi:glutathione S-transferase